MRQFGAVFIVERHHCPTWLVGDEVLVAESPQYHDFRFKIRTKGCGSDKAPITTRARDAGDLLCRWRNVTGQIPAFFPRKS